jgi:hypothetical protein
MSRLAKCLSLNVVLAIFLILWGVVLLLAGSAHATDKSGKPPVTRYWMSISTEKSSFPGMPSGMGDMGGLFGRGNSGKKLLLQVDSPKTPPSGPVATHDIPPGQDMGDTLPLVIPERERHDAGEPGQPGEPGKMEKPKMRMLIYWGCGETIRKGQPRVLDTDKMSLADFGKAMGGRSIARQNPPSPHSGRVYADWPNEKDSTPVPKNSSLVGGHYVHGNYLPDMRFTIGVGHDFMAPVEFTSVQGAPAESIRFQWRAIPTATGYFATAMGHEEKTGTMILWSSSELSDPGYALMDYLPEDEVRRLIREKVIMNPSVTQCSIPRGIFKDAGGGILQFIAYGDELNIVYPPRDPKKPVDPIWTVKARRKSTGMAPLMAMDGSASGDEQMDGERGRDSGDEPAPTGKEGVTPEKVLRGILGF